MNDVTEFSANVIRCIEEWSSAASKCNGNSDCLEECALQLRHSLDKVFPPSKRIDLERDYFRYFLAYGYSRIYWAGLEIEIDFSAVIA